MRRTPLLLLAGAVALVAPLAACGDDDDTSTSTTTTAPAATDEGAGGEGNALTVVGLDSLEFDQDSYEVAAGELTITYENDGSLDHTLLIRDADFPKLSVSGTKQTDEGSAPLSAGTYEIYCDIAGHEAAGMVAEINVS